ncbi:hypothetical protein JOQ06_020596 [Pogonophryne albipinna]|uniref:Uncharacterized protein n=1 Tax=Pogonophryne albipinna TaxID=1090488 RepID=A0AAD6BTT2_9TELE|nr:hypothetical protein JOQ06_020596 [Pogonophryne albipinna]
MKRSRALFALSGMDNERKIRTACVPGTFVEAALQRYYFSVEDPREATTLRSVFDPDTHCSTTDIMRL